MEGLVKYLARYKGLKPPHKSTIKIIVKIVKEELGISLEEENISIKRNQVLLDCHPTVRSELVRNTPKILHILQSDHNIRLTAIR